MGYGRLARIAICVACYAALVVACAPGGPAVPASQPTATETSKVVDPDAVMAQLTSVDTLTDAAEQLASVLGTTANAIRVRMTPGGICVPCSGMPENVASAEPAEAPVSAVPLPLAKGSLLWLSAGDLVCFYYFDGEKLAPQSCRIMPATEAEGKR